MNRSSIEYWRQTSSAAFAVDHEARDAQKMRCTQMVPTCLFALALAGCGGKGPMSTTVAPTASPTTTIATIATPAASTTIATTPDTISQESRLAIVRCLDESSTIWLRLTTSNSTESVDGACKDAEQQLMADVGNDAEQAYGILLAWQAERLKAEANASMDRYSRADAQALRTFFIEEVQKPLTELLGL